MKEKYKNGWRFIRSPCMNNQNGRGNVWKWMFRVWSPHFHSLFIHFYIHEVLVIFFLNHSKKVFFLSGSGGLTPPPLRPQKKLFYVCFPCNNKAWRYTTFLMETIPWVYTLLMNTIYLSLSEPFSGNTWNHKYNFSYLSRLLSHYIYWTSLLF